MTFLKSSTEMRKAKFFYSHSYPPIKVGDGVVVSVIENVDERNRREAGRGNPQGQIDILVWTKASPYEGSLDLNLDTLEEIKTVLQRDQHLGGRCFSTQIERIEYGLNAEARLYTSRLSFITNSWQTLAIE